MSSLCFCLSEHRPLGIILSNICFSTCFLFYFLTSENVENTSTDQLWLMTDTILSDKLTSNDNVFKFYTKLFWILDYCFRVRLVVIIDDVLIRYLILWRCLDFDFTIVRLYEPNKTILTIFNFSCCSSPHNSLSLSFFLSHSRQCNSLCYEYQLPISYLFNS